MTDPPEFAQLKDQLERTRIAVCDGKPPSWLLVGSKRGAIERDSTAWRDLDEWMDWFVDTYEVDLPTCWREHLGLVNELVAFRADLNHVVTSTGHELVLWHEYLDHALRGVSQIDKQCYGGKKHTLRGVVRQRGEGISLRLKK